MSLENVEIYLYILMIRKGYIMTQRLESKNCKRKYLRLYEIKQRKIL